MDQYQIIFIKTLSVKIMKEIYIQLFNLRIYRENHKFQNLFFSILKFLG